MPDPLDERALLAEYTALRTEIVQRAHLQALLVGANIALVVGLFQGVVAAETRGLTIVLTAPVIFSLVASLHLEQDVSICHAAAYLHRRIRPALQARAGNAQDIMNWEEYRHEALFRRRWGRMWVMLRSTFRMLTLLGPGVASIIAAVIQYLNSKAVRSQVDRTAVLAFVADVIVVLGVALYWMGVVRLYESIADSDA